jgi:hypothetical protein
MNAPTHLYRHFDCNGTLLYISVSLHAVARLFGHKNSAWFGPIARVEVETFPTREAALKAEAAAISIEGPVFNGLRGWRPLPKAPEERRAGINRRQNERRNRRHDETECLQCGKLFVPKRFGALTCSNRCRQARFRVARR